MMVCATCGHELRCVKTGMNVFVDRFTTYRGDLYRCPLCGFQVAKANDSSDFNNPPLDIGDFDIIHKQARDIMREQVDR